MGKVFVGLIIGLLLVFVGVHHFKTAPLDERALVESGIQQAKKDGHDLTQEQEGILRIQLAIFDYMAKKSVPPNSLSELVGPYFETVPKDPKTGQPYEYSRKGMSYELAGIQGGNAAPEPAKGGEGSLASQGIKTFINPNTLPVENFIYDATSKRDPFLAFDFSAKTNPGGATPLERYTIGQLRLTAVLNDGKTGASAIVEDASGKGFTVKVGTKIGDNNGTIISIEPDKLKILQNNVDFAGVEHQDVVEMKIQTQMDRDLKEKAKKPAAGVKRAHS